MSFLLSGFYFAVQAGGDFLIDFIIQYVPHLSSRCPTSRLGCHPTDPTPLPLALARILSDPHDKALLEEIGTSQGDFILTANTVGEYSFCFENEASLTDKMIDFEYVPLCFSPSICLVERQHLTNSRFLLSTLPLTVSWSRANPAESFRASSCRFRPTRPRSRRASTSSTACSRPSFERRSSTFSASSSSSSNSSLRFERGLLTPLSIPPRIARSFHTRNNRNESTVLSTQSRIFYYSLLEALSVCVMSLCVPLSFPFLSFPSPIPNACKLTIQLRRWMGSTARKSGSSRLFFLERHPATVYERTSEGGWGVFCSCAERVNVGEGRVLDENCNEQPSWGETSRRRQERGMAETRNKEESRSKSETTKKGQTGKKETTSSMREGRV